MQFRFAIANDHPSLPGHFPGRPIAPGVLLLGHVLTNIAWTSKQNVKVLQNVRFPAPLLPGEMAVADIHLVGQEAKFSVRVERGGSLVTVASGSVLLTDALPSPHSADPA